MLFRKTSLPVLLAFAVLVSCNKNTDPVDYTYNFSLSTDAMPAGEGVSLKDGELVGLYLPDYNTTIAGKIIVSDGNMTVSATHELPIAKGSAIYPYYPYLADCKGGKVSFSLAAEQKGDISGKTPLAGDPFSFQSGRKVTSNGTVRFRSLVSLVDFRIYSSGSSAGEKVESVYLRTTDGSYVSGSATSRLTVSTVDNPQTPGLTLGEGGRQQYANLTRASVVAASISEAKDPNIMLIAPGTYSGSVTVVTEVATYSVPFTDMAFNSESVKYYYIDLNGSKVRKTGLCNIENDKVKGFLDAVEKNPYKVSDYSYTYVTGYASGTGSSSRLDLPKPVTLRWTNPATDNGNKVITVYSDPAMTETEVSVSAASSLTSAIVYNLIPGRTWYYKVVNGGKDLETGVFKTTGRRRMIKVGESTYGKNHANNCRDFGGQVTESGKKIKYGKIFRGSNMDETSAEAKKIIREYMKIGLDVDLRNQGSGDVGKYQYDPLALGTMHTTETYGSWANLSDKTRMKGTLTKIFSAVEKGTGVYIHCKVGADRTGYVCMLLEALLGVPQERCDVDYEMTSFSGAVGSRTRTGVNNYYYVSKTEDGVTTVQGVDFINTFSGATFQEKAINYVTNTLGIPKATITAFQNAMLE